jgi:hypothetical protein
MEQARIGPLAPAASVDARPGSPIVGQGNLGKNPHALFAYRPATTFVGVRVSP